MPVLLFVPGEPLLRARFGAGSALGGAECTLLEGAMVANCVGLIRRSTVDARVVGAVAMAVVMSADS